MGITSITSTRAKCTLGTGQAVVHGVSAVNSTSRKNEALPARVDSPAEVGDRLQVAVLHRRARKTPKSGELHHPAMSGVEALLDALVVSARRHEYVIPVEVITWDRNLLRKKAWVQRDRQVIQETSRNRARAHFPFQGAGEGLGGIAST